MSTELVDWKTQMENDARAAAALERPQLATISLKGGSMMYQDTKVPDNKLPCVIVGYIFENRWYSKLYDPKVLATPDCYALSTDGDTMTPHADSPKPQGTLCADCPMFAWGSDPKGGKGKACKEVRKLAIIPATALKDDNITKAEMAILSIPVMSVKNWKKYVNDLAAEFQRPPYGILSQIVVVPDARSQFQVQFEFLAQVTYDEALGQLHGRHVKAQELLMQPYIPIEAPPEQQPAPKGKKY